MGHGGLLLLKIATTRMTIVVAVIFGNYISIKGFQPKYLVSSQQLALGKRFSILKKKKSTQVSLEGYCWSEERSLHHNPRKTVPIGKPSGQVMPVMVLPI